MYSLITYSLGRCFLCKKPFIPALVRQLHNGVVIYKFTINRKSRCLVRTTSIFNVIRIYSLLLVIAFHKKKKKNKQKKSMSDEIFIYGRIFNYLQHHPNQYQ